jgi:hypothetical protein
VRGPRSLVVVLTAAAVVLLGCGSDGGDRPADAAAISDGPQHIHGVGINPADKAVMIATHTGLFRAGPGQQRAKRVGDLHQDTMGFTVVGPDEFLGSGHPDARTDLPPLLGLIRSDDAGRSWTPVSLLGKADFHVLRAAGARIYGYDATHARLMISTDGGRTWQERRPPAPVFDLAVDPADSGHVLASSEAGLAISRDGGTRWRTRDRDRAGLLAWTGDGIVLLDGDGRVHASADTGRTWKAVGDIGGRPAALSSHEGELLVALHTNAVKSSRDGGRTWSLRVAS